MIVNMRPVCFICIADVLGSMLDEWSHVEVMNKKSAQALSIISYINLTK